MEGTIMQKEKQVFQETLKPYIEQKEALNGYQDELEKLEKELVNLNSKELNFKDNKRKNEINNYISELEATIRKLEYKIRTSTFNPSDVNEAYSAMQIALLKEDKEFTTVRDEYRALFVNFVEMTSHYQQALNKRNQQTQNEAEKLGLSNALGNNAINVYQTSYIHNSLAMSDKTLTELKQLANKAKKYLENK